jgi:hypothetical protein
LSENPSSTQQSGSNVNLYIVEASNFADNALEIGFANPATLNRYTKQGKVIVDFGAVSSSMDF